jgi:L-amino acid N-acyltransferase YncA
MDIGFEHLSEIHREPVIDIFNYYVENSSAAYREEKVDYQFFDNFVSDDGVISSYAVLDKEKKIIGFCTLEFYKNISTFRTLGDVMYFLKPEATGKGWGKTVLQKLEVDAARKGLKKIVVDISDGNSRSIEFHRKNGFHEYGRLHNCWEKHGKKIGIVFMEKDIGNPAENGCVPECAVRR